MARKIDWESQIGRRLRLRDLHVFFTVVQCGSMAKAAAALGVSQPAVSEVIADLEQVLGVRLLDRSPHGVEATMYGRALLKGGTAAFDELRQCIKQIEFLGDKQVGELRIGCPESFAASVLPTVIRRFCEHYPNVTLSVNESPAAHWPELRERRIDLVIERLPRPLGREADDLNIEALFNDEVAIAAGLDSRWAGRGKIEIRELVDEPWILLPADSWNYMMVAQAYRVAGLPPPKVRLSTFSIHLRVGLLAGSRFLTVVPRSVLGINGDRYPVAILPIDLPPPPRTWPVVAATLKNRTLSPVVDEFVKHLRDYVNSPESGLEPAKKL
jgi:DNA-binding transcriptional LysR family regulator